MKRRCLVGLIAFAATPALAQPSVPDGAGPGAASGSAAGGASGTPETADGGASAQVGGAPIIERPLALPQGGWGIDLGLALVQTSVTVAETPVTPTHTVGNTALGLEIGGGYGVTSDLTLGVTYAPSLAHPTTGNGPVALYGSYQLIHHSHLSVGVAATLSFSAFDNPNIDVGLDLGAAVRYAFTPELAIFTGTPITPGAVGHQLALGFGNGQALGLTIPVGVAWQPLPNLYAWFETQLLTIGFHDEGTRLIFADYIPIDLGGFYTLDRNFDVGLDLHLFDLEHGVDQVTFAVVGRYYH